MTVLAHRVEGTGTPLVLLNGIAMTMASWGPIAEGLAEDFTVIRCDLRGQLLSPGAAHRDVADHAVDVSRLLDHLGVASAHVVGTSFGGAVGAVFAAKYPNRVRSLISIASAGAFDHSMGEEIGRWRRACLEVLAGAPAARLAEVLEPVAYSRSFLKTHQKEREIARAAMAELPSRWFSDLISLLDSADTLVLDGVLEKIRCRTLIAAAEEDAFIPRRCCSALAEEISGAVFKVLPGVGHAAVVENPPAVLSLIRDFLPTPN